MILTILLVIYGLYCLSFCICVIHQIIQENRAEPPTINRQYRNRRYVDNRYVEEIVPIVNEFV